MSCTVFSNRSHRKIAHFPNCPVVRRIDPYHRAIFPSLTKTKEQGYRMCRCCCPSLPRKYRREEAGVQRFCRANNLTAFLADEEVHIISVLDTWRIISVNAGASLALYHRNTLHAYGIRNGSELPGFHFQCIQRTILAAMKYVQRHDAYRTAHPLTEFYPAAKTASKKKKGAIASITQEPGCYQKIKGTRKYKNKLKHLKNKERRQNINRVLALMDELQASRQSARC